MIIAAAQLGAELGDVGANLARVRATIRSAAGAGAELVVLPEAVLQGYMFPSVETVKMAAVSLCGPEVAALVNDCDAHGVLAVVGLLEACDEEVFNTAVLISGTGVLGYYRKLHLPYLGCDRYLSPGDETGSNVFETRLGRIGLAICYDIRYPESARCLALRGAQLIAQPSVWPDSAVIISEHMVPVRAAENHVYMVAVSRGDQERGLRYRGRSQIVDPGGRVLARAGYGDALLIADVDLSLSDKKHIVVKEGEYELPLFGGRRPDHYAAITEPVQLDCPERSVSALRIGGSFR